MSRLHHYPQTSYGSSLSDRRNMRRSVKTRDERGSLSGSEDGHYDLGRHDEIEEDHTLTSQTLNADGTPKRPMNAFMIFARRRRPQVSAENQSLRTGDVSKLLSKEWASMPSSEKQYYQEQAKFLKDSFNSKYPDYVYRRRPNNSRRRRRSDASTRSTDSNELMGELEDGMAGEYDHSPVDVDDHYEGGHDYHNPSRISREAPVFGDNSGMKYSGRQSVSAMPNDMLYRRNSVSDASLPYPSDRVAHNMVSPLLTPRMPASTQPSNAYGYGPQQSPSEFNQPQSWNPRMPRGAAPLWSGGAHQDRGHGTNTSLDLKPLGLPPSDNQWNSSPSSSTSSNSPHNLFATLNSPFSPNSSYKTVSTSTSSQYGPSNTMNAASSRNYDPRGTSVLGMGGGGDSMAYPARNSMSRELPPVHTIPGYSSQSASSGGSLGSAQGYGWPRDFYLNGRNDLDLMSLKDEP